jgi:hypothetical protein
MNSTINEILSNFAEEMDNLSEEDEFEISNIEKQDVAMAAYTSVFRDLRTPMDGDFSQSEGVEKDSASALSMECFHIARQTKFS